MATRVSLEAGESHVHQQSGCPGCCACFHHRGRRTDLVPPAKVSVVPSKSRVARQYRGRSVASCRRLKKWTSFGVLPPTRPCGHGRERLTRPAYLAYTIWTVVVQVREGQSSDRYGFWGPAQGPTGPVPVEQAFWKLQRCPPREVGLSGRRIVVKPNSTGTSPVGITKE